MRHLGFILMAAFTLASTPMADTAGAETVSGRETSGKNYSWGYGFDAELSDHVVNVRILIDWIPVGGVTRPQLDRAKDVWLAGIDRVWNGRYALVTQDGRRYPIVITADGGGSSFHHEVIVWPAGRGRRTDELNWSLSAGPEVAAHEIGHMIGAFDEYEGGATGPDWKGFEKNIMTSRPGGAAQPRHFEKIRRWFMGKTGLSDVSIEPMAEPIETDKGRGSSI